MRSLIFFELPFNLNFRLKDLLEKSAKDCDFCKFKE